MFCPNCGKEIPDNAKFCEECGAKIFQPDDIVEESVQEPVQEPVEEPAVEGTHVTPNIVFCQDGKYRWTYEVHLLTNPAILLLVLKALFWSGFGITVLMELTDIKGTIDYFKRGKGSQYFTDFVLPFALFILGLLVLGLIGYFVFACIYRFKYIVLFEMDEEGIKHTMHPSQIDKAEAIGDMGLLTSGYGRPFSGISSKIVASKSEQSSSFSHSTSIKAQKAFDVIHLKQLLGHNMIYAEKEDFDFVLDYILKRLPDKCKRKGC